MIFPRLSLNVCMWWTASFFSILLVSNLILLQLEHNFLCDYKCWTIESEEAAGMRIWSGAWSKYTVCTVCTTYILSHNRMVKEGNASFSSPAAGSTCSTNKHSSIVSGPIQVLFQDGKSCTEAWYILTLVTNRCRASHGFYCYAVEDMAAPYVR